MSASGSRRRARGETISLRTRLLLALAYVLVLAVVSLGVPLALSLRDRVNAEVRSQALGQADLVAASSADLIKPVRRAALDALVRSSAGAVRGRVLVVDEHARVLADSAGSGALGASYASRPEIASALRGRVIQDQRASRSLGEHILATAVPILRGAGAIGAVRVTQSVSAVQSAVSSTVAKLAVIAGVVMMLGLLAGSVIARQVALPLKRLEGVARRLAGGDLAARAVVEGSSEQRSLSTSFNEMAGRVQRAVTAQREFVADASHELRTPLTALRLRLEEASVTANDRAAQAELDAGTAEIDRLAAIVEELLVLSRAEDRELKGEPLDVRDALTRAYDRWRHAAQARGIDLHLEDEASGTAWCAAADLDRVIDVLIENAIAYAPAGSEVTVCGREQAIEVRDRGPGLAPGEELVVFERFHRGSAGRSGPSGTGLGLAIARTLARAWRGDVRLSNRPGGGALATLELPAGAR